MHRVLGWELVTACCTPRAGENALPPVSRATSCEIIEAAHCEGLATREALARFWAVKLRENGGL
jgi:hypothetical protein